MAEKFNVNAVNGTAALSIPISLAPARGGSQPSLTLEYNSGSGNGPDGFTFGGEDLVVRYERDRNGNVQLDAEGQPVGRETKIDGWQIQGYQPRIEGSHTRIERWASSSLAGEVHWRSTSRDNVTSVGIDGSSHILADLDGEGLQGILFESGHEWFYKRNLSANNTVGEGTQSPAIATPKFGPIELVTQRPAVELASGDCALVDLNGIGQLDVLTRLTHPGDGNAMGRYTKLYKYDDVGNFLALQHGGSDTSNPGWAQTHSYLSASQLEPEKISNRLTATTVGSQVERYSYEGHEGLHGNITAMPQLSSLIWDHKDQLRATTRQIRDSKITERQAARAREPTKLKQSVYLELCEIYREYRGDGTLALQRDTISVMDGVKQVAMVETQSSVDDGAPPQGLPGRLIRNQFGNYLGSVTLEVDADAQAVRDQIDAPKPYRFMGKEHDEESGLYYYGQRYYAAWIGRWISADPLGFGDGVNVFAFVADNLINHIDPEGANKQKASDSEIVQTNQNAADYARKSTRDAVRRNPNRLTASDTGSRGKLHHEFVDRSIDNQRKVAAPGSAVSRTAHNVAIRPLSGGKGEITSIGGAVLADHDNLDTAM
ncbi:toxin [Paramyrothecium foliicola]|nr:toxin [Paramyrothecium foliicola]